MSVSILNNILGPVMLGPSSSHSAAALRIGRLARDLMGGKIAEVEVVYDPNGSLVTTHTAQGSDLGLSGGLLGWEPDDERLPEYRHHLEENGIDIKVTYEKYGAEHDNTYCLKLKSETETHELLAVSLGGGMIEVRRIDDIDVRLTGGSYALVDFESKTVKASTKPFPEFSTEKTSVRLLLPVIPVLDCESELPFTNCEEMEKYSKVNGCGLPECALAYETARSGMSSEEIRNHITEILKVMKQSVSNGRKGTSYEDRILPSQIRKFQEERRNGRMAGGDTVNDVIEFITAVLETKSSMGTIVATPTAGSCGVIPGTLLAVADSLDSSDDELIDAVLSAGLIGMFIARGATLSAEEGGCMAECGAASGMVAAGLVTLCNGNLPEALSAASVALQNSFGMTCDPIGNRVEAPCLGKNTMAGLNAVGAANMALADFEHLIPLDQVIEAMAEIGKSMPRELRCTNLGGLSTTPAAKDIETDLKQ